MPKSKTEKFIDRMAAMFGPPFKDTNAEVADIFMRRLAQFDEATLEAVSESFILNRPYKTWPMPAEILNACRDEVARKEREGKPKLYNVSDDPWDLRRTRHADRLIMSDLGVQAANGGWLDALWHFCRKNERLPHGKEIDRVFQTAERQMSSNEQSVEKVISDEGWNEKSADVRRSLIELHEKMSAKAKERVERVLAWDQNRKAA